MSRINTNVQSLIAQRVLGQNNQLLNQSLERLSTGLRINRGKDDPAGLVASENLGLEVKSLNAAISNSERADQVVNIAEGGLQEVSGLLTELQGLITQSASTAGLSSEEKQANQLQIDSILQTIDRIASATSFQGIKLLNGNFDYQTTNVAAAVDDYTVNAAKFNGTSLDVDVTITQSAQLAGLYLSFGASSVNLQGANGSSFTIEIAGALGSRELTFASTQTLATIAANINTFTDVTGVTASASSTGVTLNSEKYGSSNFVSVKVVEDAGIQTGNLGLYTFDADAAKSVDATSGVDFNATSATNGIRDNGQDLGATINGLAAVADGRTIRVNSDFIDVELTLSVATSEALGTVNAFDITGGGADFQLAGDVDISGKVSLGISEVASRKLGKTDVSTNGTSDFRFLDDIGSGKSYNVVDGDLVKAQEIVATAISEVSSLRGRLGAFQKNVVGSTIRSLGIAVENTAAAQSIIRDADFASETAALTRNQILVSAATQTLGLANTQPQAALQLLG